MVESILEGDAVRRLTGINRRPGPVPWDTEPMRYFDVFNGDADGICATMPWSESYHPASIHGPARGC
jgi:hypothetical protein